MSHPFVLRCGLGLMLLALTAGPAPALRVPLAVATTPAATVNDPPTETYTYQDLFSIQVPQGWEVSSTEASLPLVIANFPLTALDRSSQAADIRTEITWLDQPPGSVVPEALKDIQAKGYQMSNYRTLTIGRATALQLWLTGLPEPAANEVITYIGYGNGTAIVSSRFGLITPEAEQLLMTLHKSFTRL